MRKLFILSLFLLVLGCGSKNAEVTDPNSIDEPDRVLYERAMRELGRNRWTVARLTLQTLINTYPDSEFLPQAKYALAESYYREGTTSALTQSELEFKDYITFFPTSDLADDAQLFIAMTHVKQMEKPDRDRTQALLAEAELKSMISTYPDSSHLNEAKEKLRGVQEVLAEGVYKIGNFYYIKGAYAAAADRYTEVLEKYPDFSRAPETLYYLAESLRRNNNGPESVIYYARIVTDHPLSESVASAKERLTELKAPIPSPNPVALARAQQEQHAKGLFGKMFSMFSRRPDISTSTTATSVQDAPLEGEGTEAGGDFSVDGKVVTPQNKPPAKNAR